MEDNPYGFVVGSLIYVCSNMYEAKY